MSSTKDEFGIGSVDKVIQEVKLKMFNIDKIKHKIDLRENVTVADYLVYISLSNAQAKSTKAEKAIKYALNWKRVQASEDAGDFFSDNNKKVELKTSFTNIGNKMNVRQIRQWQGCDYLLMFVDEVNMDNSRVWYIPHHDMNDIVEKHGGACHRTKTANANNINVEMSLSLDQNCEALKPFERSDLKQKILTFVLPL